MDVAQAAAQGVMSCHGFHALVLTMSLSATLPSHKKREKQILE